MLCHVLKEKKGSLATPHTTLYPTDTLSRIRAAAGAFGVKTRAVCMEKLENTETKTERRRKRNNPGELPVE